MTEQSETITWFIDRVGDRSINPYSINSVAHIAIMDYLNYPIINNTIINDLAFNYDLTPTIPFAPLVEVLVVPDIAMTEEEKDCCVCQEERENTDICRLNCAHTFCSGCIKHVMNRQKTCPLCRAEITQICVQTDENKNKITNGNA